MLVTFKSSQPHLHSAMTQGLGKEVPEPIALLECYTIGTFMSTLCSLGFYNLLRQRDIPIFMDDIIFYLNLIALIVAVHICNLNTWEVEARRLMDQDSTGSFLKTMSLVLRNIASKCLIKAIH